MAKNKLTFQARNTFSWIPQVEATDPDAGNNGQIKYSIDFESQQDYFSINESTGEISLLKLISPEEHQTEEFLLLVTATDGKSLQCPAKKSILMTLVLIV